MKKKINSLTTIEKNDICNQHNDNCDTCPLNNKKFDMCLVSLERTVKEELDKEIDL